MTLLAPNSLPGLFLMLSRGSKFSSEVGWALPTRVQLDRRQGAVHAMKMLLGRNWWAEPTLPLLAGGSECGVRLAWAAALDSQMQGLTGRPWHDHIRGQQKGAGPILFGTGFDSVVSWQCGRCGAASD